MPIKPLRAESALFNAHHSPVGAFATFTLGAPGASGGFGLEQALPAELSVFVGLQSAENPSQYDCLPFFQSSESEANRYDVEIEAAGATATKHHLYPFAMNQIERRFGVGSDTWQAGDLNFALYSPPHRIPDPHGESHDDARLQKVLIPSVYAELTIDNRSGQSTRTAFFGFHGKEARGYYRRLSETSGQLKGLAQSNLYAIATADPNVTEAQGFTIEDILAPEHPDNIKTGLGTHGAICFQIPAGKSRTVRFVLPFFKSGIVTTGRNCEYYYTRWWKTIEAVGDAAWNSFEFAKEASLHADDTLLSKDLSDDRSFMLAQAIRSYYGATQLFYDVDIEKPVWVVNEGEYRMMNTFDLTVDQLFFELRQNPWTVRDELNQFIERYAYEDAVRLPEDETEYPGGIAFTHDMGIANSFSRPGYSAYEKSGLKGCFSQMTHEELVNWVLCASAYIQTTDNESWLYEKASTFRRCLDSLINRDHPMEDRRNGIMGCDSSRCAGGSEITTYDSLDLSLGQARNNLYLAVKTWAAYVCLRPIFSRLHETSAIERCTKQALRAQTTLAQSKRDDGTLPAVLFEGVDSLIIPAIEGLIFPYMCGLKEALDETGEFGTLLGSLRNHHTKVMENGGGRFANGGWKLSSTSDNSWLSKIYLCQYISEAILGFVPDDRADAAHRSWLVAPENRSYAWSDQMLNGKAVGSRYYPRGVTSILWNA